MLSAAPACSAPCYCCFQMHALVTRKFHLALPRSHGRTATFRWKQQFLPNLLASPPPLSLSLSLFLTFAVSTFARCVDALFSLISSLMGIAFCLHAVFTLVFHCPLLFISWNWSEVLFLFLRVSLFMKKYFFPFSFTLLWDNAGSLEPGSSSVCSCFEYCSIHLKEWFVLEHTFPLSCTLHVR